MKYKVGDYIKTNNSKDFIKIVDCETINGINLYYMSNNTSFAENQIVEISSYNDILKNDSKKFISSIPKSYWKNELDNCIEYSSKKIIEDKKNKKVSWLQENVRWLKWQLKFK